MLSLMPYGPVFRLQKQHKEFLYILQTRNMRDYMKSSVKVCEPSEFLKLLEIENKTE